MRSKLTSDYVENWVSEPQHWAGVSYICNHIYQIPKLILNENCMSKQIRGIILEGQSCKSSLPTMILNTDSLEWDDYTKKILDKTI